MSIGALKRKLRTERHINFMTSVVYASIIAFIVVIVVQFGK